LDLLIGDVFQECASTNDSAQSRTLTRHNIFMSEAMNRAEGSDISILSNAITLFNTTGESPSNMPSRSPSHIPSKSPTTMENPLKRDVVGLSSSPVDLANGQKCIGDYKNNPQVDADCNVIKGKVTAYLSNMTLSNSTTAAMLEKIKSIMDDDLLDDCHPAILSVMYMTQSVTVSRVPSDDLFEEETVVVSTPGSMWMFGLIGIVGVMTLAVSTRYRYSTQFRDDGSGELRNLNDIDSRESFIEIDSRDSRIDSGMPEI
jgi:hypothetical protein